MEDAFVDARRASRYEAKQTDAYLGWWQETGFRTREAALRNVSHGGALVVVDGRPPEGSDLWLCGAGKPPSDWAAVEVVEAVGPREGRARLHLRFAENCPYELFLAAALGVGRDA